MLEFCYLLNHSHRKPIFAAETRPIVWQPNKARQDVGLEDQIFKKDI